MIDVQVDVTDGQVTAVARDGERLAELSRNDDGEIRVWWDDEATPTATDAAVGQALAAAFGTGKKFFLPALLEDGTNAVPG